MFHLLECALALEKHGNYRRAARHLRVSQPTVTRAIQELERLFSVTLFDRTNRGSVPTAFGALVLESARRVALDIDDLKRDIALLKGLDVGELHLGIGPIVAQTWMPDAVAGLLVSHPHLRVRIVTQEWWDLVPALRERRIDIGIGELDSVSEEPDIVINPLPHRPLRFYCRVGHPLMRAKRLTVQQIGEYALVAPKLPKRASEFLAGTRAIGKLAENGQYFEPQIECQTLDACLRIVRACDAIGIAPLAKLEQLNEQDGIALVPFQPSWLRTNYGILSLRNRSLTPAAIAFCERVEACERLYHERRAANPRGTRGQQIAR
jgi:DNA-binding transcriptional LysR family regulator